MINYEEVENPFKVGMTFKTYKDIGLFLNLADLTHGNVITGAMKHYCEWHRDGERGLIYIDKVFEKVKNLRIKGFKYEIGDIISVSTGEYKIIDRYIKSKEEAYYNIRKFYLCKCLIDEYIFELPENRVKQGIGCPICGNKKIIPGIRSLYDTHPEVLKYMANPEEAKKLSPKSDKKILCKCPECGSSKECTVHNLTQFGFTCSVCSDNISYPNKYIRCVLDQLNIYYIPEKSFDWSNGKLYDQYIESNNMIIENHGLQHYENVSNAVFRSLKEEQSNDEYKYGLAINNNIDKYIVIDCRKSESKWIKNSIMESELPQILNFVENDIDWDLCDKIASTNSEIKKVCEAYKSNNCASDLAEQFHHDIHTILNYLEIGAKCGYCDYEKNNRNKSGLKDVWQVRGKPIYCETDDMYFMSSRYCEEYYSQLGETFNGKGLFVYINENREYKGRLFKYIDKTLYNSIFDKSIIDNSIKIYGERYLDKYIKEE